MYDLIIDSFFIFLLDLSIIFIFLYNTTIRYNYCFKWLSCFCSKFFNLKILDFIFNDTFKIITQLYY